MQTTNSNSFNSSLDMCDRTLDNSSGSMLSDYDHRSVQEEAAEDFKLHRSRVDVKHVEKTAKEDGSDVSKLTKEELLLRVRFLANGIRNQEIYIRQQEERQERNRQLIAHVRSLTESDRREIAMKQRQCDRLVRERERYERIIRDCKQEVRNSSARRAMAQRLNDGLVEQKVALENRRDVMLNREVDRGISAQTVSEYMGRQRLLAREQEKRQNLMNKMMWYEKEMLHSKTVDDRNGLYIHRAIEEDKLVLPEISTGNQNLVSRHPLDYAARPVPNITELAQERDNCSDGLGGQSFVPRPPDKPREEDGAFKRFCRRFRSRD